MEPSECMLRVYSTALGVLFVFLLTSALSAQAQPDPMPIGSSMPSATLQQAGGGTIQLPNAAGETGTVVIFWSNQCPWVDRYEDRVTDLVNQFQDQGIRFLLVNSNDASAFPQESLEVVRERASDRGYAATYVRDANATLARAVGATRTPHVFVFDENETLVYTGTIDDSPSGPGGVSNRYLANALQAVTAGEEVPTPQTKAFGCTIKFPGSQ